MALLTETANTTTVEPVRSDGTLNEDNSEKRSSVNTADSRTPASVDVKAESEVSTTILENIPTATSTSSSSAQQLSLLPPDSPPLRAILFDFHGTLTPYCQLSLNCINTTLSAFNLPPFPPLLSSIFNGAWRDEAISFVYEWMDLGAKGVDYAEFFAGYNRNRIRLSKERVAIDGVLEVLEEIVSRVRVGGAEGGHRGEKVEMILVNGGKKAVFEDGVPDPSGISKYFTKEQCVVVGDIEARTGKLRKKPMPDIYLHALHTINTNRHARGLPPSTDITPAECLVFEDSFNGVQAAFRAGMNVVWIAEEEVKQLMRIVAEEPDPVECLLSVRGTDGAVGCRTEFVTKTVEKKVRGAVETMECCIEYREKFVGGSWEKYGFLVLDDAEIRE